jgi:hypothetical protein
MQKQDEILFRLNILMGISIAILAVLIFSSWKSVQTESQLINTDTPVCLDKTEAEDIFQRLYIALVSYLDRIFPPPPARRDLCVLGDDMDSADGASGMTVRCF